MWGMDFASFGVFFLSHVKSWSIDNMLTITDLGWSIHCKLILTRVSFKTNPCQKCKSMGRQNIIIVPWLDVSTSKMSSHHEHLAVDQYIDEDEEAYCNNHSYLHLRYIANYHLRRDNYTSISTLMRPTLVVKRTKQRFVSRKFELHARMCSNGRRFGRHPAVGPLTESRRLCLREGEVSALLR